MCQYFKLKRKVSRLRDPNLAIIADPRDNFIVEKNGITVFASACDLTHESEPEVRSIAFVRVIVPRAFTSRKMRNLSRISGY